MTIDQFLKKLATKRDLDWCIAQFGRVRTKDGCHCPISAVIGRTSAYFTPIGSATKEPAKGGLGMPIELANNIVSAADNVRGVTVLRKQLLSALKLKELS